MGFKFGNAAGGAAKGAVAGSSFGPWGAGLGGILGGITGGFSKDIDKKVTGNSGSGTTNNLLNIAGLLGGAKSLLGGGNPLQNFSLGNFFGGGNAYASTTSPQSSNWSNSYLNPASGMGPSLMNTQQSSAKSGGLFGGGLSSLIKNPLLLGAGLMGGSQLLGSPKVPQLPQSTIDFQSATKSGNPLQNQASQALQQQLDMTQQNLGQPEIDAINRQYDLSQEQELKSVDSMYKSLRPGSDPLTDTAYQKDLGNVKNRYATLRADSMAQAQRQISNDFLSQRANTIAQSIGLGQQQLAQLSQLSQIDLDRQLSQLQMDYQDKSTLRNYILQLGGNIAASQFQKNPLDGLFSKAV